MKIKTNNKQLHQRIFIEFKLVQLQSQAELSSAPTASGHGAAHQFRIDTAAKLLPTMVSEQDIETFLIAFEKMANMNKWPRDKWASVLQTRLKGKGVKVFSELGVEDCQNYEKL